MLPFQCWKMDGCTCVHSRKLVHERFFCFFFSFPWKLKDPRERVRESERFTSVTQGTVAGPSLWLL